jgi:serine/threonine-protein kinase
MQLPQHPVLADRWRLLAPIGEGAMGEVWHGRHEQLGHDVAVKVMKEDAAHDENLVARFRREARIAAQLRSKHIVRVEDFGTTHDGRPFLVMEYLRGQTLAAVLEKQRRPDRLFVLKVVQHIATACDVAHPAGIVHRDLKPENCFIVTDDDGEPLVKVLDFGVAKVTDNVFVTMNGVVTGSHALLGTPVYMSPEQARGEPQLDGRSDLWSLGVIAYEMLAGHIPFDVGSLAQVLYAVLAGPIAPLTSVDPTLAPSIDAWLSRALNRDRSQRFSTGKELASALAAALGFARVTPSGGGWASMTPPPIAPPPQSSGYVNTQAYGAISGNAATVMAPASQSAKYPAVSAHPSISEVRTTEQPVRNMLPSAATGIDPSALTWSGNGGGGVLYPPVNGAASHASTGSSDASSVAYSPTQFQQAQYAPNGGGMPAHALPISSAINTAGAASVHTAPTLSGVYPGASQKRRVHPMGIIFLVAGLGGLIALASIVSKRRHNGTTAEIADNSQTFAPPAVPLQPLAGMQSQPLQPQPLPQPAWLGANGTADAAPSTVANEQPPSHEPPRAPHLAPPTSRPVHEPASRAPSTDPIEQNPLPAHLRTHTPGERSFDNP